MLKISKNEAMYLASKNFKWNKDIFTTHSRWHHYYCVAAPKIVKVLNNYREKILVK